MNTHTWLIPAAILPAALCAQPVFSNPAPDDAAQSAIGPNHRVEENVVPEYDGLGGFVLVTNRYVTIASGLNYWRADTQTWEPSVEAFELVKGHALAVRGQTKLILVAGNINSGGSVDMESPSGERFLSNPMGISFWDPSSQKNVLLAEVKDCAGQLTAANEIVFSDCFDNLKGALVYRFTREGVSQDLVLYSDPGDPAAYGLSPEATRLEMYTEFHQAPDPSLTTRGDSPDADPEDQDVDFGSLRLVEGVAHLLHRDLETIPVAKRFEVLEGKRRFLIESVRYADAAPLLRRLQARAAPPSRENIERRTMRGRAGLIARMEPRVRRTELASIQKGTRPEGPGLVLDYSTKSGSLTNMVFTGDTTWFISGNVSLVGSSALFEAGAVLKLTNGVSITASAPVSWEGSPYRPVVLTSFSDNSIGDTISGSTGDPSTNYAGVVALDLGANVTALRNLRISHMQEAIRVTGGSGWDFRHVQMVHCGVGVRATNATVAVRNALFHNVQTNFTGSGSTLSVEHLTADGGTIVNQLGANLSLKNSLVAGVTSLGSGTVTSGTVVLTSSAGVFQAVGAGAHYLAAGSPYRNYASAVTNGVVILPELRNLTTYPPIVLATDFTASTTLSPQAQRDTDQIDLGFHADPLDYCWSALNLTNATLTLTNGVAVGYYGTKGTVLRTGAQFFSEGTAERLNRLAHYTAVQEQSLVWGAGSPVGLLEQTSGWPAPVLRIRFTDLTAMGAASTRRQLVNNASSGAMSPLAISHSQLHGIYLSLDDSTMSTYQTIAWTNNVLERCYLSFGHYGYYAPFTLSFYNQLFRRGTLTFAANSSGYTVNWTVKDCLFDCDALSGGNRMVTSNNGYRSGLSVLTGSQGSDKTGLVMDYQSGSATNLYGVLAAFYYPTNGTSTSLTNLINAGSRTAAAASLYHFTTTTNQVKEAATQVDIGYHYVALDSAAKPLDYDGDGLPDYFEDRNGDGSASGDPTSWQSYNSPNGLTGSPGLQVFSPLK